MRAKEFIKESTPAGRVPKRLERAIPELVKSRDPGGYDRTYHMNRFLMAAAMADGKDTGPVDMDSSSFIEKFNLTVPYTDEEHNMIQAAMNTIPTDGKQIVKRGKSEESPTVNKISPVYNWQKELKN